MEFSKAGGQLYEFAEDLTLADTLRQNVSWCYDDAELMEEIKAELDRRKQLSPEVQQIIEAGAKEMNPGKWVQLGMAIGGSSPTHSESRVKAYAFWCDELERTRKEPTADEINAKLQEQDLGLNASSANAAISRWVKVWRKINSNSGFNIPQC
jgi:hypothetical protein